MAYQPKSYRKFVATAATATLVASAIAPAALAASSFTDVAPKYKEAVDYLFDNGITKGKTETLFGTHDNIKRGELAIWLVRALGLEEEAKEAAPSGFADVAGTYYDGYVSVLKEAKILDGISADEFGVNAFVTRGQMAKLLSNAYGLTSEEEAPFTDMGQWAPFINGLYAYEITTGKSEELFGTAENITRGDLAIFMLRAEGTVEPPADEVAPVLSFDGEKTITLENGADFELPEVEVDDEEAEVYYVITDAEGNEVEELDTTVAGTYTLTFTAEDAAGNVSEDLVFTVVVEEAAVVAPAVESVSAIGVKTVEVKFNQPVDTTKAVVQIKKGAAIYSSKVEWNAAKDTATVTTVIDLPAADYTAVVTGLTEEALTQNFTVAAETASNVEVTASTLDDATATSQVAFVVENQYGEDMEVLANDPNVTVSAYNVTQSAAVTLVAPGANQYFEVNTLTNADAFKVGDVIRFTVTYKGLTTQSNVLVADPSSSAAIEFGNIVLGKDDTKLNVSDATVKLDYTLLDQYGKTTDFTATGAPAALPTTLEGVQFISSDNAVISDIQIVNNADGKGEIVLTVAGAGTAVITAVVNESGTVAKTTITVEEDPTADAVVIAAPTKLVASQDAAFDLGLTVTDQYGDLLDSVSGLAASIDLAGASVALTDANDLTKLNVDLTGVADATVNETKSVKVTIADDVDGDGVVDAGETVLGTLTFDVEPEAVTQQVKSASFAKAFEVGADLTVDNDDLTVLDQYGREIEGTITIESSNETVIEDGTPGVGGTDTLTAAAVGTSTLTVTVDGKTLEVPVKVIASTDIQSYTVDSLETLYASAGADAYDAAVSLSGVDASGNTVKLASTDPEFITSSNTAVADVDSTGLKVDGVAAGTATINAWKGGKIVASTTVTVSEAAPVATTVEIEDTAVASTTTLADLVTVLDQYGVAYTENGYFFVDDVAAAGTATLTAGTHTVKYVTKNGVVKSVEVTVAP